VSRAIRLAGALLLITIVAIGLRAQTTNSSPREPSKATRPFVVLAGQSLDDLRQKLQPDNKVEELIDSNGMQLRVAVQHDQLVIGEFGERLAGVARDLAGEGWTFKLEVPAS